MSIVEIPIDLQQFVQMVVSSGAYHSESEVVAEGLRLLQRREQIRRDVNEGIAQLERGEYTEYDETALRERFEQIKIDGRKRLQGQERGE